MFHVAYYIKEELISKLQYLMVEIELFIKHQIKEYSLKIIHLDRFQQSVGVKKQKHQLHEHFSFIKINLQQL